MKGSKWLKYVKEPRDRATAEDIAPESVDVPVVEEVVLEVVPKKRPRRIKTKE